ncbi:flagellar protein FliT [Bacillus sp. FJAT-47783]|uniref:flagellar protein FliT n=1 Tax=Bacillus sp. FJAT-47783 TaxID=2922712 RepID=UPI001FAD1218|nr:flagellar protein FliT [Bacillus sp. FJAT-47783]
MDRLNHLLQLTESLIKLTKTSIKNEREHQIEQMDKLLAERDVNIKHLKPPYSPEEIEKGRVLVQLDQQLRKQLEAFKMEIKKDIIQLKVTKQSTQKYVSPYEQQSMDGMFYDKRK